MSQQAMTALFASLPESPALAGRFRDAVEQNEGQQAIEAVARVAAEAGYDVDSTDVAIFRASALELLEDGDLSEEHLEKVSGGVVGEVLIAGGVAAAGVAILTAGTVTVAAGTATLGVAIGKHAEAINNFFSKW